MEIKEILELGGGFAKNQSDLVIRIISTRSEFVRDIDHDSEVEFKRAVAYAFFLSLIGLILALPTLRLIGANFESISFLLIDTLATVGVFFLVGCANHVVAKLLKGVAKLRSSIVTTVYMATINLLAMFLLIPVSGLLANIIITGTSFNPEYILDQIKNSEREYVFVAILLISSIVNIYWLVIQAKAFRIIHHFGAVRTWAFGISSFIALVVIQELLILPMMQAYHAAFIPQ